jgi:hypothetical protein
MRPRQIEYVELHGNVQDCGPTSALALRKVKERQNELKLNVCAIR